MIPSMLVTVTGSNPAQSDLFALGSLVFGLLSKASAVKVFFDPAGMAAFSMTVTIPA